MTTQQAAFLHQNADITTEALMEQAREADAGPMLLAVVFGGIFESIALFVGALIWRMCK